MAKNLSAKVPRGIRLCNPCNIRKSSTLFVGEVKGSDRSFKTFKTMEYGYRAAFRILKTYYDKYNLKTIRGMVGRWAPPKENNTAGYISTVSDLSGKGADEQLLWTEDDMVPVVAAMSRVENGRDADLSQVRSGWRLL